ncbi:hypothetical protein KFK09_026528 [Dendrobium nobile]|uniref:Uncharacterized protein n=1 Tax=Dendrobium nobile TaxID=94219 RepID=A0A8T3A842_DENNO|nr:hypothetical protein KFK09_026528 [Dendrobium nobile]
MTSKSESRPYPRIEDLAPACVKRIETLLFDSFLMLQASAKSRKPKPKHISSSRPNPLAFCDRAPIVAFNFSSRQQVFSSL